MNIYNILELDSKEINESIIINEQDIYYNKEKFDSGEINLCFITGHSGSGKTTMGRDMQSRNIEHYELDDLQCIKDRFSMDNLKEYGDLIYSFFKGIGKQYYIGFQELKDNKIPASEYEDKLYREFVHYAMKYANMHKYRKFILEGIWLFGEDSNKQPYFKPEEFKEYAFYIKGTSMIISKYRGAKRDAKEDSKKDNNYFLRFSKRFFIEKWKYYILDEKRINIFRKYFSNISTINESSSIKSEQLYSLSQKENIKTLTPRIPDNFFTRNGYEDDKTPRVCFSTDISKCLMGLSSRCTNKKYYVYQPDGEYKVISPSKKQVPDVEITNEKWICEKVNVKCIGEILCIDDKGEDGIPYTYGPNNEYTAELYEWNWKWVKKYKKD